jgi:hypothetical protein
MAFLGTLRLMRLMASRNCSRSSAFLITGMEAPIISTGLDPLPIPLPYKSVKKPAKASKVIPVN